MLFTPRQFSTLTPMKVSSLLNTTPAPGGREDCQDFRNNSNPADLYSRLSRTPPTISARYLCVIPPGMGMLRGTPLTTVQTPRLTQTNFNPPDYTGKTAVWQGKTNEETHQIWILLRCLPLSRFRLPMGSRRRRWRNSTMEARRWDPRNSRREPPL